MKKALKYLLSATVLAVVGFCFAGCGGGEKTYEDEQGVVYSLKNNKYTVTSIKDKDATTFDIPESINGTPVTALANFVFAENLNLKTVTLPDSLEDIGNYAFSYCPVDSITLPQNLKFLGDGAFAGCALKEITIPDGITEIKGHTFASNPLMTVNLPANLVSIGNQAFAECEALQSITLPQKVETIGDSAFSDCTSLSEVKLPSNLTSIGRKAFSGCSELLRVSTEGGNSQYFSLPQTVTEIGDSAFMNCAKLKLVNVPDNVVTLGYKVFDQCTSVTAVTIGNKVETIADGAFGGCPITSLYLPVSLKEIGYGAFSLKDTSAIFYAGTEEQWDKIAIGEHNGYLKKSNVTFNTAA